MKIHWSEQPVRYDGTQLRPHWIYQNFNLQGDALVAFLGPCDVNPQAMLDLVDQRAGKGIYSKQMLHFIGEFFQTDLTQMVLWQRLFVSLVQQEILFRTKGFIVRSGNDLFDGEAKLSVSIASASPLSSLFHFGINVTSDQTPVKTKGLADYGIEPTSFARSLLETFKHEVEGVHLARAKVRPVL